MRGENKNNWYSIFPGLEKIKYGIGYIIISAIFISYNACTLKNNIEVIKYEDIAAFKANDGRIQFNDSCITLYQGSFIELVDSYKNFELNFECRTEQSTIGALYFHTYEGNIKKGYEVFINNGLDTDEWRKTGGLTAIRNFGKRTANNNTWFPVKVTVVGKQIRTFVNNKLIVDYTEPEKPYRELAYEGRILFEGNFIFSCKSGEPLMIRNINVCRLPNDSTTNSRGINEQADDIIKLHQRNFPTIDCHIHTKGGFSQLAAERVSRKLGITYGVAPNCGQDFPIKNDEQLLEWLTINKDKPFLMPMQAEGREWTGMFSLEAISQFDYVFTDALTWSDSKGRRLRLWIPEDTFIEDEQAFMEELTGVTCRIIESEPIHVLANPTYLPQILVKDYDRLWTEERMLRIIEAAVKNKIALELNNLNRIPSAKFIKLAKQHGVKFTFGTNNANNEEVGKMEYLVEMIDECGLTASDMYIPESKNF